MTKHYEMSDTALESKMEIKGRLERSSSALLSQISVCISDICFSFCSFFMYMYTWILVHTQWGTYTRKYIGKESVSTHFFTPLPSPISPRPSLLPSHLSSSSHYPSKLLPLFSLPPPFSPLLYHSLFLFPFPFPSGQIFARSLPLLRAKLAPYLKVPGVGVRTARTGAIQDLKNNSSTGAVTTCGSSGNYFASLNNFYRILVFFDRVLVFFDRILVFFLSYCSFLWSCFILFCRIFHLFVFYFSSCFASWSPPILPSTSCLFMSYLSFCSKKCSIVIVSILFLYWSFIVHLH